MGVTDLPFSIKGGGSVALAPVVIPDNEHTVQFSIPPWTNTRITVGFTFEFSFDGTTWLSLGTCSASGGTSPRSNSVGATFAPLPLLCSTCGAHYLPGDDRYARALSHSTIALKSDTTLTQLRQRLATGDRTRTLQEYQRRICMDAAGKDIDDEVFVRTFHTPTPILPANRQVRVILASDRAFSSTLTIASS